MLDEIVGFSEQGFSLYIMSFWNAFDLGILLLLMCYYGMRLYGILMPEVRKHQTADMAYDLLAANAVLLFPRLFSVLDHYRYFSQLLIAFRMMAMDMAAVFILIIISCSGFFVAFTLSFGRDGYDANGVAYQLFQILLGYTPAAWDNWESYNLLGKAILTFFLFICHFLIVTILITVLTNSFMAIVQNANDEHQFVFAVNTISMVKSEALFSYVAPTNVIAWILSPLRLVLPFRQFVRINRTVIKVTHFQILFMIYAYERIFLSHSTFDTTDPVERRGRPVGKAFGTPGTALNLFSPRQPRLREPSVATHQKDRALDEVFRRPFRDNTIRNTQKSHERRKTSNVVNSWMQNMGPNGTANPPDEQDRSVVERLEARKLAHRQSLLAMKRRQLGRSREFTQPTMSVASDPEEKGTGQPPPHSLRFMDDSDLPTMSMDDVPQQTDADGDDELVTNDEDENIMSDPPTNTLNSIDEISRHKDDKAEDYFHHQSPIAKARLPPLSASWSSSRPKIPTLNQPVQPRSNAYRPNRGAHSRNTSNATVLYDPVVPSNDSSSSPSRKAITARNSARNTGSGNQTPVTAGRRTPKRPVPGGARPRPIMPPRNLFQSAPDLAGMWMMDNRRGRRSSLTMDLGSDLGDNKAVGGGFVGAIPSSFTTQMAFATGAMRAKQRAAGESEDQRMMGKLMLARMNTLEEGFRDILKEVKDWRKDETRSAGEDRPEVKFSKNVGRRPRKEEKGKSKSPIDRDNTQPKADGDFKDRTGSSI